MMGMVDMDHYQKVKYEINKVRNKRLINQKLYAWGSNQNGQLSFNSSSFYRKPTKVILPCEMFVDWDYISNIYCDKMTSIILTFHGKFFIIGNSSLVKEKEEKQKKEEREKKDLKKEVKKNKRKSFDIKDNLNEGNDEDNQGENKWCQLNFYNKYEGYFKIKDIYANNNIILTIGYTSSFTPFCRQEKKQKLKHRKKDEINMEPFITCEEVIKKLQNSKSDLNNYYLVYENPRYGLLENTVVDFMKSEVPFHKVLQMKFYREIIWDRKKRFMK